MKITTIYFGDLSCNNYKIPGTRVTKPRVKKWMEALAQAIKDCKPEMTPPITIKLSGRFRDSRYPDLSNLHKVLGDAVEMGLGINDRYYKFLDGSVETGCLNPELDIEVEGIEKVL